MDEPESALQGALSDPMACGCRVRQLMNGTVCLTHSVVFCPLHAAAPEMLEALKALLWEPGSHKCGLPKELQDRCFSAIVKAEGKL